MALGTATRGFHTQEAHWIPSSELMTGLLVIFLFISIVLVIEVKRNEVAVLATQDRVKDIAVIYSDLRTRLFKDLKTEFHNDFWKWRASISGDLSIRFQDQSILFDTAASNIKPEFASILDNFFPRYAKILTSPPYRDAVEEVRIEDHTSSIWKDKTPEQAYYENMRLSQERTRSVLEYVFSLPGVRGQLGWLVPRVTADGLSSARRVFLPNGDEDALASQRIEFKVRTNADDRLAAILKALGR